MLFNSVLLFLGTNPDKQKRGQITPKADYVVVLTQANMTCLRNYMNIIVKMKRPQGSRARARLFGLWTQTLGSDSASVTSVEPGASVLLSVLSPWVVEKTEATWCLLGMARGQISAWYELLLYHLQHPHHHQCHVGTDYLSKTPTILTIMLQKCRLELGIKSNRK